jgi:sugar phosphate isomerase/epimerase
MIKLGFERNLSELSFEEVIEFAADNGLGCIEIPCWPAGKAERKYAGVSHIDVADLTEKRAGEINKILKKSNVIISGLGYYPNPLDPDESKAKFYIEHLKKVIAAAAMLGVPVVNTFMAGTQQDGVLAKFKRSGRVSGLPSEAKLKSRLKTARCISPMTNGLAAKPRQHLAMAKDVERYRQRTYPLDPSYLSGSS